MLRSAMASFLHRSRTTSRLLFQNRKNPNPLIPLLHPKSLHPTPPLRPSNPSSPLPFFSPNKSKIINPYSLQNHSISITNTRSQSFLTENPTIKNLRRFSSAAPENPQPELRHQEIIGPTVERDISSLANETREVLESLQRSIYDLSSALAVLGVTHLVLGTWIAYAAPPSEVSVQGIAAFAFPFSVAFLLRRTVKPMSFFQKMEAQGRLQILTLALQDSKSLQALFMRMRVVCVCCVVGVSAGSVVALWVR